MRPIAMQNLDGNNFRALLAILLDQGFEVTITLEQIKDGNNRRAYAIHKDEWEILPIEHPRAVALNQIERSGRLRFFIEDSKINCIDDVNFRLQSLVCIDSQGFPKFIYASSCNNGMVAEDVQISPELIT